VAYLIQNPKAPNQEIHELRFGANTIGRELDNTIVVMHKSLSRHHAKLTIADDGVTIADLGSRNHTFVNEANINQCELQDGDLVRCGSVVFKFLQALETSEQEPLRNEDSNLSILKSFIPEKTNVQIQDLLHEESLKHQGTVLKLRQQDANQRTVDKLKILLEVSKQLSSPEDLDKLLEKVLALLFTIMDVDRAVILLLDRKTGQLERKAAKFRSGIPTDDRFYSTTIANSVQQNAKALLITDAHVDQRFNTSYSILKQAMPQCACLSNRESK
jgi:adenylate cyclase